MSKLLEAVLEEVAEARRQAELAYAFCPSDYTHRALAACTKALRAMDP
jgi:hypothetical protein